MIGPDPAFDAPHPSGHILFRSTRGGYLDSVILTEGALRTDAASLAQATQSLGQQLQGSREAQDAALGQQVLRRHLKGVDSYLSALDAQRSYYSAQQGLVSLRLAVATNAVTLYKVLGGGAQAPDGRG